jgi:hypothetical protein
MTKLVVVIRRRWVGIPAWGSAIGAGGMGAASLSSMMISPPETEPPQPQELSQPQLCFLHPQPRWLENKPSSRP